VWPVGLFVDLLDVVGALVLGGCGLCECLG